MQNYPLNRHRPPHIYQPNSIYFITDKTYQDIPFLNSQGRKQILKEVFFNLAKKYNITIYSWVILDNHAHYEIGIGDVPKIGVAAWSSGRKAAWEAAQKRSLTAATPRAAVSAQKRSLTAATPGAAVSGQKRSLTAATPGATAGSAVISKKTISKFFNQLHSITALKLNQIDKTPGRKIWYQYWDRCIRSEKDFYTRLNYIHHNPVKHGSVNQMSDYQFSSYNHYLKIKGQTWLNDCFAQYPIIDFTPEKGLE